MSINREIVQSIIKGIRQSMKTVILPELTHTFPVREAVSIYVILKTIDGYTSPEFSRIMSESNRDCEAVLKEIEDICCKTAADTSKYMDGICSEIESHIDRDFSAEDPESRNSELNKLFCEILRGVTDEATMERAIKDKIRKKIRWALRRQLDRELALLT